MSRDEALAGAITSHIKLGCSNVSNSLGSKKMPRGYALMLNRDQTHFYWLRHDGKESQICWDKWAVYRGAQDDIIKTAGEIMRNQHR